MVPKSEGEKKKPITDYRSAIAHCCILQKMARPDISYGGSSRLVLWDSQPAHWNAIIKRILLLAYTYFVPKRNLSLRILVRRKIWRRYWLYWFWWRLGWLQVNVNNIFFYKSGLITRMYRTIIYFGVSILGDRVLPVYSTLKNRNKYIQLWGCGVKRQETREFIPENLVSVVNRHFFKATWWIIQTKPVIYSSQVLLLVQSSKTVLNRILLK